LWGVFWGGVFGGLVLGGGLFGVVGGGVFFCVGGGGGGGGFKNRGAFRSKKEENGKGVTKRPWTKLGGIHPDVLADFCPTAKRHEPLVWEKLKAQTHRPPLASTGGDGPCP